jgi:hypothetical protein
MGERPQLAVTGGSWPLRLLAATGTQHSVPSINVRSSLFLARLYRELRAQTQADCASPQASCRTEQTFSADQDRTGWLTVPELGARSRRRLLDGQSSREPGATAPRGGWCPGGNIDTTPCWVRPRSDHNSRWKLNSDLRGGGTAGNSDGASNGEETREPDERAMPYRTQADSLCWQDASARGLRARKVQVCSTIFIGSPVVCCPFARC